MPLSLYSVVFLHGPGPLSSLDVSRSASRGKGQTQISFIEFLQLRQYFITDALDNTYYGCGSLEYKSNISNQMHWCWSHCFTSHSWSSVLLINTPQDHNGRVYIAFRWLSTLKQQTKNNKLT